MSTPTLLLLVFYGAFLLGFTVVLWRKPLYVKLNGERIRLKVPALKLLFCVVFGTIICLTLIPHLLCRFVGLRGFYYKPDKSYQIQNPFRESDHG